MSTRVETFQDLSLPIPSRDHVAVLHNGNTPTTNGNGIGPNGSASSGGRNAACSDAVYSAASSQEGWVRCRLFKLLSIHRYVFIEISF